MLGFLFICILCLFLIGAPIFVALGMGTTLSIMLEGNFPLVLVPQRMFAGLDSWPIKTTPLIRKGFEAGKDALLHALSAADMNVLESRVFHDITGDEMLLCVDAPAEKIKDLTQQIEERHPYGRLFDMDVIGTDGMKLSRSSYRKCLICNCQAQECARARRHTVAEMQDRIEEILGNSQNPVNLY